MYSASSTCILRCSLFEDECCITKTIDISTDRVVREKGALSSCLPTPSGNVATCLSWRSEWISLITGRGRSNERRGSHSTFELGDPSSSFVPPLLFSLPEVSGQAGMSLSRHLHPEPCTYPLQFPIFVVPAKSTFYFYEHRFFQHENVRSLHF